MNAFWWAVLSAGIWGIVPLMEKAGLERTAPMAGIFYRCLGVTLGAALLFVFAVRPAEIKAVDHRSAALLMFGGLLASVLGQIFFYQSLKTGEVSKMVFVAGCYPFLTFLLGVLFIHESFSLRKGLASALILGGLWLLKKG